MHEPTWQQELPRMMDEARPDRYTPGGADDDWIEVIVEQLFGRVSIAEAQRMAVRMEAERVERRAMKRGNQVLRDCLTKPILDPAFYDLPLSVGNERVAFRAMTPNDFRTFANEERKRAAADFTTREETCRSAETIAVRMDKFGWKTGAEVRFE